MIVADVEVISVTAMLEICALAFSTVTVTGAEVVLLLSPSYATTLSVYVPSLAAPVFQIMLHAPEVIAGPRLAPLSSNWRPMVS